METTPIEKLQLLYTASNKSAEELRFLIQSLCNKQRNLLINLLQEERETIQDFVETNSWAADRVNTIDSILTALDC